jgi:hypothetical protein
LGGKIQHAATAAALDLAHEPGTRLTALASIEPFEPAEPTRRSALGGLWRRFYEDVDPSMMRDAACCAVRDFEKQAGRERRAKPIDRAEAGGVWSRFVSLASGHDLAVVSAEVGLDGGCDDFESETATRLALRSNVPVLRVSRRPLAIDQVLIVIDNTPRCWRLAQTLERVNLWPNAGLAILPIGCDRPLVEEVVRAQIDHLERSGGLRRVRVLSPLSLDFEVADLIDLVSGFHAAVLGQLSNRIGISVITHAYDGGFRALTVLRISGAVRNDAHEVVAKVVPMVLLPARRAKLA